MVKADPGLAWIKEAEARGDVDWRAVQEIHDSYKYSNNSLGAAPTLIISIVAAYFMGPVYGAMASNLAVGTINNGGDIGKGLQHATSSDALKSYAMAYVGERIISPALNEQYGVTNDNAYQVTKGFDLSTWGGEKGLAAFAQYNSAQALSQAVMQQAAFGGSFMDNLGNSMAGQGTDFAMALGFNSVGNWAQGDYGGKVYLDGSPQKVVAHAMMGGLLAEASGSDFKTGAMAAGVNEAMANVLGKWAKGDPKFELMESQIVGVLAAMAVNGDVSKGAEIAKNATAYNRQLHPEEQRQIREKAKELEAQYGKIDLGSLTWEDMLTLSAGTAVDKAQSEQYLSLLKQLNGLNPDSSLRANFDHISEIALNTVSTMGMGSEPLRWANGEPILAHGQPVYAFQATAEQFADSNLFNQPYQGNQASAAWANLSRAVAQYGQGQATNHNGEIVGYKGQEELQNDIRTALGLAVGDGILTSTPEDYLIPAGGAAKGAATATGKLVKEFGGALIGRIEAKLTESAAAQAATKGIATAEVPATSAAARAGLRDDLAAQAGIPRNIVESPSSMWGKSIDDIKQSLTLDGATLTPKPARSGSSGKAQVFTVEGHPAIKEVEYHPGGGVHGDTSYYKFIRNDGVEVRVINPSPDFSPGTITRYQQYFDTQGNRLKYEGGQWKVWE
ncbi:DUF637 domain-containing protein [Pseudomonas sp. PDNC002]|nr:DUF637 domain-containing protein [Pseudomonas sp. PDNC002]